MAVFGAPTALEDNAFRVCLAALGFRRRRSGLPSTSKSATVWTSGCVWDGTPVRQMQRVGPQFWHVGPARKWRSETPRTRRRSPALCLHTRDRTARQVSRRCRWSGRGGASRLDIRCRRAGSPSSNRSSNAAHFPGVCGCWLMCGHAGYAGTTGHLRTPTNGPAEHGGDMDLGLAERTALVCASTSGLGLATARALCEDGARVVVSSRSSERAEAVAAALPNAIGIGCDLLAADGAARLFGESTKRVGKIDILVLNGPGPAPGTAADVDDAGVDSAVAALVKPQVQLVRSVLPAMQAQRWGRILSISSTSIVAPIANLALSNLGRAALAGYLKCLANEVAAQGITVNSLLPGRIATPRARQINEAAAARSGIPVADVEQSSTGEVPAGRYGEPDEFGAVAAFLCSARASYVTGAALRCDGGLVPTL